MVTTEDAATGQSEQMEATHVFSTIPACYLAPAVRGALPKLASALDEIKFVDMAMVHVGFNARVLASDGFGYLVPTAERERVLGVVFDSNTFPVQNASDNDEQTRVTVMSGGAHLPNVRSIPSEELEATAVDALRRHLGIERKPDFARVLTMQNAIPQYHVGFAKTLGRIEQEAVPGLYLGGNSFYGIGLADCVTRSKELALKFASSVAK